MSSHDLKLAAVAAATAAIAAARAAIMEIEEAEHLKKKRPRSCWVKEWKARRDEKVSFRLLQKELKLKDKKAFRNFIRMDERVFETLFSIVERDLTRQDTCMRKAVPGREKLAATLRFLSTGETYKSLEYQTRLSIAFLSDEVPKICNILYEKLRGTHLKIPSSQEDWDKIVSEFQSQWNFPLCIGALDCKHIAFRGRREDGAFYRNCKGFNSIILMALVDANCRLIYTNIGCNGRISDDGVLRQSNLMRIVENASHNFQFKKTIGNGRLLPYVIVGDNAFALHKDLMKPYPCRDLERKKIIFNRRLSRAQHTAEHAFGILANRFRVLQSPINLASHKVNSVVKACCVLHNFLIDSKETEMVGAVASTTLDQPSTSGVANELLNEVIEEQSAGEIREEFAEYFSNEGKLEWLQL